MSLFALAGIALIGTVKGHGAVVHPISRNSVDRAPDGPDRCACANSTGNCSNGQACYWYSQGCFIGCPKCDSVSGRIQSDLCGLGMKPTLNDPQLRTVNRNATPMSEFDIYQHNPWRAPGYAPLKDSCGLAGGTPWPADVAEWGDYVTTDHAAHGYWGSKLDPVDSGVTWKIGSTVETIWQITANHGGGYIYRLCPADQEPTEECFNKNVLDFVRDAQQLQFANGSRIPIKGTFVNEGTLPANSTWAMNPIPPRCLGPGCTTRPPFCQPCPLPVVGPNGPRDCTTCDNTPDPCFPPPCDEGDDLGLCSGNEASASVVDRLSVPSHLTAGKYVLGWRLDCEATAQVWANCADVTLTL